MDMTYTVTLDSESVEYQELQSVVDDLVKGGTDITVEQYVNNIVFNWLETRVRETYHAKMRLMSVESIKTTMGDYAEARSAAKDRRLK